MYFFQFSIRNFKNLFEIDSTDKQIRHVCTGSGKSQGNSSLSQSQGNVWEICCKSGNFVICYQSQGKVGGFRLWSIWMHTFHYVPISLCPHSNIICEMTFFLNFIHFHVLRNVSHKISTIFMMLKTVSCADLFSMPLCQNIYWWILWFLCAFG